MSRSEGQRPRMRFSARVGWTLVGTFLAVPVSAIVVDCRADQVRESIARQSQESAKKKAQEMRRLLESSFAPNFLEALFVEGLAGNEKIDLKLMDILRANSLLNDPHKPIPVILNDEELRKLYSIPVGEMFNASLHFTFPSDKNPGSSVSFVPNPSKPINLETLFDAQENILNPQLKIPRWTHTPDYYLGKVQTPQGIDRATMTSAGVILVSHQPL